MPTSPRLPLGACGQVPEKERAKPARRGHGAPSTDDNSSSYHTGARTIASLEDAVARLGELTCGVLEATATMIEKKQARTYEEVERDLSQVELDNAPIAVVPKSNHPKLEP